MRLKRPIKSISALLAAAAVLAAGAAWAELQNVDVGGGPAAYKVEVRIYQVLTYAEDIEPPVRLLDGLLTLTRSLHQRIDGTELIMKGDTLTWNGQNEPQTPRIIGIGAPSVIAAAGVPASIQLQSSEPVQYMTQAADGSFALQTFTPQSEHEQPGMQVQVTVSPIEGDGNHLNVSLEFQHVWVADRERLEKVNLSVGQPIFGYANADGSASLCHSEWNCFQTPIQPQGKVYLFMRVSPVGSQEYVQEQHGEPVLLNPEKADADTAQEPETAEGDGLLKRVEVHGSTRIRWEKRF